MSPRTGSTMGARRSARWLRTAVFAGLCGAGAGFSTAQEESAAADEMVVMSPFEVSAGEDRGYVSSNRIVQPRFAGDTTGTLPTVPITVIRRADAVVVEFALSNSADKQDARNRELTESVELIAAAIKATPGLRFENREVQLATGNRSRSIVGKGGVVTSFANFAVFAELAADARLFERVKRVRGLVSAAKLVGGTKVIDGPVALWVRRPAETRAELLGKIFADLDVVRKGVGADAELLVSGLSGPVRVRACSESEVELWIDYGSRSARCANSRRSGRRGRAEAKPRATRPRFPRRRRSARGGGRESNRPRGPAPRGRIVCVGRRVQ